MTANTPLRVLLVEDDDDDQLLLTETLDDVVGTTYEITWVDNAADAIDMLRRRQHDVCLLDYRLGASTGLDVLHGAADALAAVPCIFLTGIGNSETDRDAMEAGAVDYLVKNQLDTESAERAIRYAIANAAAARQVTDSEARFRSVFEGAHDGIAVFTPNGDVDCANPAACAMFGLTADAMHGSHFSELLAEAEVEPVSARFRDWDDDQVIRINAIETVGRRRSGSTFPLELSVTSFIHEGERCWSAVLRDTSRTTELLDQLAHQTLHDRLTGLANRTLLRERIERAVRLIGLSDSTPALLVADIDDFKKINDLYGHDIGDQLLTLAAERLRGAIRSGETLARVGSDEFAVLAEGRLHVHAVIRLAERLRTAMHAPFLVGDRTIRVSTSIGIALAKDENICADDLIRNADVAMYTAKANGKDRVEVFEERMYGDLLDIIALDNDLLEAITNGELTTHYQPIFSLDRQTVHSFEALARWHHPDRGWVRPDVFIGAAERSGAIDELGLLVLAQALDVAVGLDATIAVAVNVSSHQLRNHRFVHNVRQMLDERGLSGSRLIVEVTESMLLGDVEQAVAMLSELRALGVRIALDDFGTGYSSLAYLRKLPIDEIKLDQSFVRDAESPRTRALIDAVATIASSFDITSIAEGIETEREYDLVAGAGFTCGQGFLLARPMPANEIGLFMAERTSQHA